MEPTMSDAQSFSFKDYSLSPVDLIPDDEDCTEEDYRWQEYCRVASAIARADVLRCVLSDLDADDSPLWEHIDLALREPHEPGRARDSVVKSAALRQAVLDLIAKNINQLVTLRQMVEVPIHD
jgi:hypothetical protein